MKILLTTNARLYKTSDGKYWTEMVYGYDFFKRYLEVFKEVRLIAHTKVVDYSEIKEKVRVDGIGLEIHEVFFPAGKIDYIKNYKIIKKQIEKAIVGCQGAILRIPDQLAFQVYKAIHKIMPVAVEVTSNSREFFSPKNYNSFFRPFLRVLWHKNQKRICSNAIATSYVTRNAIQDIYPPKRSLEEGGLTAAITDLNLDDQYYFKPRVYKIDNKTINLIHVAGNIGNDAKGYRELFESMQDINEKGIKANLTLVGSGKLSNEAEAIKNKYNINSIRFTGLLSNKESLIEELKNADIFVFPSYNEGLPRVILEAMASGLPCVATKLPGIKELINEKYLVELRNSKKLSEKLFEIINNPTELTNESKRNFEKAKEYHASIIANDRFQFYSEFKKIIQNKKGDNYV